MSCYNQLYNYFCCWAVYMPLVPFFLILLLLYFILVNSESRSTGQTQLVFITSYRSSQGVRLILVTNLYQQRRKPARYVKSVWEGSLVV